MLKEKGNIWVKGKLLYPKYFKKRSQDLKTILHDAGQFYWAKSKSWINNETSFNHRSTVVKLPNWRVHDIDTLDDWKTAELKYKALKKNEKK